MVANPQTAKTGITYAEWLKMPRTTQPHEVIDGDLIMSPAPTFRHQWILGNIYFMLRQWTNKSGLGVVVMSPVDVVVSREPVRTRQPDIAYLAAESSGVTSLADAEQMPAIEVAPDLVVELLSPDERRQSLRGKLADYAVLGVLEVWLVSPEAETIEVLALNGAVYTRSEIFGRGDVVTSEVLPGLDLAVDSIFE
jgi:Uma2 family endonuclease